MSDYQNVLFLNSSGTTEMKDLTTGTARWGFSPPLSFPKNDKLKIAVYQSSFTNFFINITTGVNDTFYYTDDVANPVKYTITIPQGSYNVSDLSDAIDIGVVNNGHTSGLITLTPDFSSNRVIVGISAVGWQVYFPALSQYVLLGATLNQKVPLALTTGAYNELLPNVATFNSLLAIYVHCSLTNHSIFNGSQSDVIAVIIPTAPIGSIQSDSPTNLLWVSAPELSDTSINSIQISLTDQNGVKLNLSDDFNVSIIVGA